MDGLHQNRWTGGMGGVEDKEGWAGSFGGVRAHKEKEKRGLIQEYLRPCRSR